MKVADGWFVYILECRDNTLYTGITNNLEKRMATHKAGKGSKYVKARGFKKMLHTIKVATKSEALKMEYRIKQLERNDKITFLLKELRKRNHNTQHNQEC